MYVCVCVCVCIYVYIAIDPVITLLGIYSVETICTSTKIYVQTYSFHSCLKEKQETKEQPTHPSGLLLLFSHLVVSDSLWPRGLQHTRLPCPSPSTRVWSNSCRVVESLMQLNHLIPCFPLLLWPSVFPSIRVFSSESVNLTCWLQWVSSLHQIAKVLELQLRHLLFQWILRVAFV